MADQYDTLRLVGRHVPDQSAETNPDGTKYTVDLPGHYEAGFMLGGTFMALGTFKAGNVLNPDGTPTTPPPDQPSGEPQATSESGGGSPSGGGS